MPHSKKVMDDGAEKLRMTKKLASMEHKEIRRVVSTYVTPTPNFRIDMEYRWVYYNMWQVVNE